jgi:Ca2+-binding RTX toxin-like protein
LSSDQTTGFEVAGKTADAAVSLSTADDTDADGTTIDLTVGAFVASTYVKTLNLDATAGKFTATSTTLDIAGSDATTLTITGTKQVTLGTTDAKTINSVASTGVLSLTLTSTAATASVTSGSAADSLTINDGDTTVTLDAGNGANTITLTSIKEGSSFVTGSGADTVNVNDTEAVVISTGSGDDTIKIADTKDTDAVILAGSGDDTLDINWDADVDFSDNGNFKFTGVETVDIQAIAGATVTISVDQLNANPTFDLVGAATTDNFEVVGVEDEANTIDASGITVTTATVNLTGGDEADVITGTASADVIFGGAGADTITGGSGSDTVSYAGDADTADLDTQTGIVVNLGLTAITATTILANTGDFLADAQLSVAANKATYLYADADDSYASVIDSLSSVENVVGSAGNDYIVGSSAANTITGNAGDDYINLGLGADTFSFADRLADPTDTAGDLADVASAVGSDTIASFSVTDDEFQIDLSVFTLQTTVEAATTLAATEFASVANAGTVVNKDFTDGGIVYNQATGEILYVKFDMLTATSAATNEIEELTEGTDYIVIGVIGTLTGTLAATDFNVVL